MWEPFFTTKAPGEGSGLGLATVYGIARQAGGGVAIVSIPGSGTQVDVYMPATECSLPALSSLRVLPRPPATGARILLVEDEPSVRDVVRRILERAGYEVLLANCGDRALEVLAAAEGRCDLLLTDVIMPGMWGDELATRSRLMMPTLPILFMSGYSERFLRRGRAPAPGPVLTKPFRDKVLLRQVANLIGATAATQTSREPAENTEWGDDAGTSAQAHQRRSTG